MADKIRITFDLTERQADAFSQTVKRLARNRLGPDGLNVAAEWEVGAADESVCVLRDALRRVGFDPR